MLGEARISERTLTSLWTTLKALGRARFRTAVRSKMSQTTTQLETMTLDITIWAWPSVASKPLRSNKILPLARRGLKLAD